MEQTVCFTGHREIPASILPRLRTLLEEELERLICAGAVHFRTGGALGFDTLAAECVLAARVHHPAIRLHLILPSPDQSAKWSPSDIAVYEHIRASADTVRYISPFYYDGVLQARNRALAEHSELCVAYLTSSHGGGAAYTASLALKGGAELINLADQL